MPKDRRQANKGQPLEALVEFANERYKNAGIAFIEKQATEFIPIRDRYGKICSAKVEHKATFDFLGRWKHYPIAIEAKNTNDTNIRFDRIEDNQAEDMDTFTAEPGTIGLVIVSFEMKRFYVIPWAFWSAAYNIRVRQGNRLAPATVSAFGQTWTIPKKSSFNEKDINPMWAIPPHDTTFGIHYLQNAEKYIIQQQKTVKTTAK